MSIVLLVVFKVWVFLNDFGEHRLKGSVFEKNLFGHNYRVVLYWVVWVEKEWFCGEVLASEVGIVDLAR